MNRRKFLGTTAAAGAALIARPHIARAAKHELLVAEPVHSTGYLPMYIAMAKGYFAEADIEVKIVTIETGGGHTNAVLSGQAFAFIGGPEHNAFAKAKGAELRAVVTASIAATSISAPPRARSRRTRDFACVFQGQDDRGRRLRRHAELDHALPAGEVETRRQEGRHADRDAELGGASPPSRAGKATIGVEHRAADHAGHQAGLLGRAVLQRAEGARSLRLFDHQHPAQNRSRRSRRSSKASCAA